MPSSLPLSASCQNRNDEQSLPPAYSVQDGDRESLIHALSMGFHQRSRSSALGSAQRRVHPRNMERRQELADLLDEALNIMVDFDEPSPSLHNSMSSMASSNDGA
jgi:hypothetical protein